jgi:hypothetical protein
MAITLLTLVNRALATIGERPVVNLDEQNKNPTATIVKNIVEIVINTLLVETDWNCARKTNQLERVPADQATNILGYLYQYKLPTDCLQVRQVSLNGGKSFVCVNDYYNWNSGPKDTNFDIEDGFLLSNSPSVIIKYTAIIDPSKFDPLLAEAFSAKLAAELAYAITASTSNADYLSAVANKKLKKAVSRNALNRNVTRLEGEVIGARGELDAQEYRMFRQTPVLDEGETNGQNS